jgi:hypothetical protein
MVTLTRGYETLRLVASVPVLAAAHNVHTIVINTAAAQTMPPRPQPIPPDFNAALNAVVDAMRAEIGVD